MNKYIILTVGVLVLAVLVGVGAKQLNTAHPTEVLGSSQTSPAATSLSIPAIGERDVRRISDLQEIRNNLKLFFGRCNVYPGGILPPIAPAECAGVADPYGLMNNKAWQISKVPLDPLLGVNYGYCPGASGSNYTLHAVFEDSANQALRQSPKTDNCGGVLSCNDSNDYCVGP